MRNSILGECDILILSHHKLVEPKKNQFFRCFNIIPTKLEKLRLQNNWKYGIYEEKSFFYSRKKFMPWLKLEKDRLWFSRGPKIYNYKRDKDFIIESKPTFVLTPQYRQSCVGVGFSSADVTKFAVKNNLLVAGLR